MEQISILRHAVDALESIAIEYMVVGSYASVAYGEARFTQDIDIVVDLRPHHITRFLIAFSEPEYYRSESAIREAVRDSFQFNVLHPTTGNKLDFMLPRKDAWGRSRLQRARPVRLIPDRDVMTASPEDIIIGKLWYYSEGGGDRHLRDISGILRVTGEAVNRSEIERWAKELGYLEIWNRVIGKSQ